MGRVIAAPFLGPLRWFQERTWRATAQLAVWFVTALAFTVLTAVGRLAAFAARVGGRGTSVKTSALDLRDEVIDAELRRIEFFTGVEIRPRRLAQARLLSHELASTVVSAVLTAAAVAWWWVTAASLDFLLSTQYDTYYEPRRILRINIGSSKWLSLHTVIVAAGVLLWPTVVRVVPAIDLSLARRLLGPGTRELSQEVTRLSETRAEAVAAADAERRRIERDLHDGFQPQLVNLALSLGLARSRLSEDDPDGVGELLERAHTDAKRATEDLRSIVRGIHPSVLDERGLDAAFSSLAASSHVPVQIDVRLDRRPPREAEGIAYFVVAEAITNVNKHARARVATVTVSEINRGLWVLVQDDGAGGARVESGGGLSGLAARVASVDGTFSLLSPEGGPTWLEARIPCEW